MCVHMFVMWVDLNREYDYLFTYYLVNLLPDHQMSLIQGSETNFFSNFLFSLKKKSKIFIW